MITVFSPYKKEAAKLASKYYYSRFIWIRYNWINKVINGLMRMYSFIVNSKAPHFGIIQILYYLKRIHFDIVIIEGAIDYLEPVSKIIGREKVYLHLHSATLFGNPNVFTYCNKVIAVSNYIKNLVLTKTSKREEDVLVIKNCIDISSFNRGNNIKYRTAIRQKYGISDNDVVICFTGRLVEGKGVRELIQSVMKLPEKLSFKLLIVGSAGSNFGLSNRRDDYYLEITTLAKQMENKVIFTGFIHNSKIPKILSASDIAVIPSIDIEAQGLTVLEGLAAGLPVVTTDSGGIPENVTDESAYVIKRDINLIDNLSLALESLIDSKDKREAMGMAGLKHVQQYSYDNYYIDFLNLLTSSSANRHGKD
jgi:glycosyltransferase involved in cell wall biosynthesis